MGPVIQHMWEQEKVHKEKFEQLIPEHRARPSFLTPFWSVAGYALGAGNFLLRLIVYCRDLLFCS